MTQERDQQEKRGSNEEQQNPPGRDHGRQDGEQGQKDPGEQQGERQPQREPSRGARND